MILYLTGSCETSHIFWNIFGCPVRSNKRMVARERDGLLLTSILIFSNVFKVKMF